MFLLSINQLFAQKQEELIRFVILEHLYNDIDLTDWSFERESYMVFYSVSDDELYFANVTIDAQSYGKVSNLKHERIEETSTTYLADYWTFRWSYVNTYDNGKGSCLVELTKIYKENAVSFTLKMIDEKVNVSTYKGYVQGSLNLENYN